MSFRLYQALPGLGVLAAVLSGCSGSSNAPVSIEYRQIGFCNTYPSPGGERAAKPNEVFVVYKIDAVDNSKRNAAFTFLPTRLYIDRASAQAEEAMNKTPPKPAASKTPWVATPGESHEWIARLDSRRFIPNDTSFAQAMSIRAAAVTVIAPGAKTPINGYAAVAVVNPDESRPVEKFSFNLNYDRQEGDGGSTAADPSVIVNATNAAQTSWPHTNNCQELNFDKLAS